MSATLLPSPCKRTTGRPSLPHRRPLYTLRKECDGRKTANNNHHSGFNPRTPYGVRQAVCKGRHVMTQFQSTHSLRSATPCGVRPVLHVVHEIGDLSLRSATAADLIHCYSTEQIILCANLPKKTVIARLHFLSIYLSIFYSQRITPIADLPGNSCELEVGAQAMFNSL